MKKCFCIEDGQKVMVDDEGVVTCTVCEGVIDV